MEEEEEEEEDFPFSAWLRDQVPIEDSVKLGQHVFELIIHPTPVKQFMKRTWQREPLLVQRKQENYYEGLFSTAEIDEILRDNALEYGENIDLTFYNPVTKKKERHNPAGIYPILSFSIQRTGASRPCSTSDCLGCLQ